MNNFIWFYGIAGAGKNTLIDGLAGGKFRELNRVIPTHNRQVFAASTKILGGDKDKEKRLDFPDQIASSNLQNTTLLIKGQTFDLRQDIPPAKRLKELLPDDNHLMIFVWVDKPTAKQHLSQRAQKCLENGDKGGYDNWSVWDSETELAEERSLFSRLARMGMDYKVIDNSGDSPKLIESLPKKL